MNSFQTFRIKKIFQNADKRKWQKDAANGINNESGEGLQRRLAQEYGTWEGKLAENHATQDAEWTAQEGSPSGGGQVASGSRPLAKPVGVPRETVGRPQTQVECGVAE